MRRGLRCVTVTVAAALVVARVATSPDARRTATRTVYLMGTRATLTTVDDDRDRARARLDRLLETLEATEAELSTWRDDSALSRLNATPVSEPYLLTPSLCRTLLDVGYWVAATGGAFDPSVKALGDAWHVRTGGALPDARTLDRARRTVGFHNIRIDERACVATRTADTALDAGAFGKGEALDRAADVVGRDTAWLIDLGGQVAVGAAPPGSHAWTVDLAHPRSRDTAALTLELDGGSLATSGGSERDSLVNGVRVGHILDPRTGRPGAFSGSVTVWHERALVADVLSTALYVLDVEAGLVWAEAHAVAAVYLVPSNEGKSLDVRPSSAFSRRFAAARWR